MGMITYLGPHMDALWGGDHLMYAGEDEKALSRGVDGHGMCTGAVEAPHVRSHSYNPANLK